MLASGAQLQKEDVTIERICAKDYKNEAKRPQFISIVVYVHDNCENIETFTETVMGCVQKNFAQCEIVYVDDYSSDESVEIIKEYFKNRPTEYYVSIIRMGGYQGLEVAMNAGRDVAIGDYVYEFDNLFVDFDPSIIIEVFDKCMEGYDIVTASTDGPVKWTSKLFYSLFNKVSNMQEKIGQDTWRLISRRGINRVTSLAVDIPYRKAVYLNSGLSVAQVHYNSEGQSHKPRITGNFERLNLGVEAFIYFTQIIERIAIVITCILSVFCVVLIAYSLYYGLIGPHDGTGRNLMLLVICVGFTGVFCLLAVILKYLAVLINLVFKRQKYKISDIEKIC